jgi:hypothetical protein
VLGLQGFLDKEIKAMGVENSYFPLFVTKKAFSKEEDHVEGFAPEVLDCLCGVLLSLGPIFRALKIIGSFT